MLPLSEEYKSLFHLLFTELFHFYCSELLGLLKMIVAFSVLPQAIFCWQKIDGAQLGKPLGITVKVSGYLFPNLPVSQTSWHNFIILGSLTIVLDEKIQ